MFGVEDLRRIRGTNKNPTICPVVGCETEIGQMRGKAPKRLDKYLGTGETGGAVFERVEVSVASRRVVPTRWFALFFRDVSEVLWSAEYAWRDSNPRPTA